MKSLPNLREVDIRRDAMYRKVLYIDQFFLTLSWTTERTALVVHTLKSGDQETIDPVAWATIRIVWETMLVAGGMGMAIIVMQCKIHPTTAIKNAGRAAMICMPLLFAAHLAQANRFVLAATYSIFFAFDGAVRNARTTLLAQCSPRHNIMRTLAYTAICVACAALLGSLLSLLCFQTMHSPYLLIHMLAASFYFLSFASLQFLGDCDCSSAQKQLPTNPVTEDNVAHFMMLGLFLLPLAYITITFYEIWGKQTYSLSNSELEATKLVFNGVVILVMLTIACTPSRLWYIRRWWLVVLQSLAAISLGVLAFAEVPKVGFLLLVSILFITYGVSKLINLAMLMDHLSLDNATLTKWSTVTLVSRLLTRCGEVATGSLIDQVGFSNSLVVSFGLASAMVLVSLLVADFLHHDLKNVA
jgi:hypothetical protein